MTKAAHGERTSTPFTNLPEGVIHEAGDIYLVPFDMLQVMKLPTEEDGSFRPINVRHLGKKSANPMSSHGMQPEDMLELQASISDEGWFGAFLCRWKRISGNWGIELVAGERRCRSIGTLRTKNQMVRDRSKDKRHPETRELIEAGMSPAMGVYKYVRCEIKELDDEEAQTLNILENDKHVGIGEKAGIRLVAKMREWGWDDEKILKKLKKSGQWLRDTEAMIDGLGEYCLQAVYEHRINRTGAMLLTKIENEEERKAILDDCARNAWDRAKGLIEKRKEEKLAAERNEELAELRVADAECNNDEDRAKVARTNLQEATSDVERRRAALAAAEKSGQAGQKDVRLSLRNVRPRSNRNQNVTAVRPAKIRKHYAEVIQGLIDRDGRDEEGNLVANTTDLYLARDIIEDILFGRTTSLIGRLRNRLKLPTSQSA